MCIQASHRAPRLCRIDFGYYIFCCIVMQRYLVAYVNKSLHLARKYDRIFVADIGCSEKRTVFRTGEGES